MSVSNVDVWRWGARHSLRGREEDLQRAFDEAASYARARSATPFSVVGSPVAVTDAMVDIALQTQRDALTIAPGSDRIDYRKAMRRTLIAAMAQFSKDTQ